MLRRPILVLTAITLLASPALSRAATPSPSTAKISKVLVIVEENHSSAESRQQMPYLSSLANRYGYATNYFAISHPSLPNYLAIIGGDTFGIADDDNPSRHPLPSPSVFGQALSRGKTAKVYAETMPTNCYAQNSGLYAVRHTAWPYFPNEAQACAAHDVALGSASSGPLAQDAQRGSLPNVGLVIPNLCNDAHDCSLKTADSWLRAHLSVILGGADFTSGKLAVVIVSDEDDRSANNNVVAVVLAKQLSHRVTSTRLDHYSLTGFIDAVIGAAPLRRARGAPAFAAAFGLGV